MKEKFQLKFKNGKCPGSWVEQDLGVFVGSCLRISIWCVTAIQRAHGNYLERTGYKTGYQYDAVNS